MANVTNSFYGRTVDGENRAALDTLIISSKLRLPNESFGTFTPTFRVRGTPITYLQNSGSYYVIGQLVYFGVTLITTSALDTVATNPIEVLGIPFLPGIRGFFGTGFLSGYDVLANIFGILPYNQNLLFWDFIRMAQLVDNGTYVDLNCPTTAATRNWTVSGVFLRSQITV